MPQKKIPFYAIERAIRANCLIDQTATKPLMMHKSSSTQRNKTIGRSLFIYLALSMDYTQKQICSYLVMTEIEWCIRLNEIPNYFVTGKVLYDRDVKPWEDEAALLFYRKFLLVRNYLAFKWGVRIEEPV